MTIFEAFKKMTVEEMAVFLFPQGAVQSCPRYKLKLCDCHGYPNFGDSKSQCINKIIEWLNSEVKLDDSKLLSK